MSLRVKKNSRSLSGKIIIAFLLACTAIIAAIVITNTSFRKILQRVDQLSTPNTRLQLVNQLFREIVMLDQMQHNQASRPEDSDYSILARESAGVQQLLDSLKGISSGDILAANRIDSMKRILYSRDQLLRDYLKLNRNLTRIDTLQAQIRSLTGLIEKAGDSARVSTQNRIVTTIEHVADTPVQQERQSLWARIFNRKKTPEVQEARRLIRQYYDVKVDTMGVLHNDSSFYRLSAAIEHAEQERLNKRNVLLRRQQQLTQASNLLIARSLRILRELEEEELSQSAQSRLAARDIVNKSISNINLLLVAFIFVTGILVYVTLADVARSNTYRRELIEARDEAEQLGAVKQRFLANMSHELRTPLQIIIGMTEQLERPGEYSPERVNIISQASRHLLQVVNEVLDYSRIVSGKFVFDNQPFSPRSVLEEVAAVMQVQAKQKGLAFETELVVEPALLVSGDAFRLKQVLYNLLGNAVKFTPSGTIRLSARQQVAEGSVTLVFQVTDTGIGIAAADLEDIFNRFEQSGEYAAAAQSGSGLGLNIARLLVEAAGGRISVSSTVGAGSCFEVVLPFDPAGAATEIVVPQLSVSAIPGTVWVVDDDPFILGLCRDMLVRRQVKHHCFSSAAQLLAEEPPADLQAVLMDIRMPDMNGMELCRILREQLPPPVRLIALTAQAMPDELETIRDAGFDTVLTKPFLERDFVAMVAGGPVAAAGFAEVYDLDTLRRMVGEEALPAILKQFITANSSDVAALRSVLAAADQALMAELLHRIAGRVAQVGAADLAAGLRAAERRCREQKCDTATVSVLLQRLELLQQQLWVPGM